MFRSLSVWLAAGFLAVALVSASSADQIKGDYLETRTCDVYTGPCFANSQVSLGGKEAILAWSVKSGAFHGVDLAGMKVVVAVKASDTLGFGGGLNVHPDNVKSVVYVDSSATQEQRDALVEMAKARASKAVGEVQKVVPTPIEMSLDRGKGVGKLSAGKGIAIETRKLATCDCVCTNERVFYPPLAEVKNSRPAFTVNGHFSRSGLGTRWSNQNTRSAFLATFAY